MEAVRPQPIVLEGLSRFLVEHEGCGSGFDVAHPTGLGSGRVEITCRGCGGGHEYSTTTIEVEREIRIERIAPPPRKPQPAHRAATPAPDLGSALVVGPGPDPVVERMSSADAAQPAHGTRSARMGARPAGLWREHGLTIALMALAVAALAFAAYRVLSDDDPAGSDAGPASSAAGQAPTAAGGQAPTGAEPPPAAAAPALETVRSPLYVVRMPRAWARSRSGAGLRLAAPGGGASVTVFHERDPAMSRAELASGAAGFLRRRNPRARVSVQRPPASGGAFAVEARGPARRETAVGFLAGDLRYLLIRSEPRDATRSQRRQARLVQASFEPRPPSGS